jgi:hypothetical protein
MQTRQVFIDDACADGLGRIEFTAGEQKKLVVSYDA